MIIFLVFILKIKAATFTAHYNVVFESNFCNLNNYSNCPSNPHMSSIFGGSHNYEYNIFTVNGIATDGLKSLAETGGVSTISAEWDQNIYQNNVLDNVLGRGISSTGGSTTFQVEVKMSFNIVSFVSMIAPSPDWFVGVDSLPLLNYSSGEWHTLLKVELYALDAGTDAGTDYTSQNSEVNPRIPVSVLNYPPLTDSGVPVATLTFRRIGFETKTPTNLMNSSPPTNFPSSDLISSSPTTRFETLSPTVNVDESFGNRLSISFILIVVFTTI